MGATLGMTRVEQVKQAEDKFRIWIVSLGATPEWDRWLGTSQKHRVICKSGHECWPRPVSTNYKDPSKGICRLCYKDRRMGKSEAKYRAVLAELGATPAWDTWLGVQTEHKVMCSNGHECWPIPYSVTTTKGGTGGVCRPCGLAIGGKKRREKSELEYVSFLTEIGATPAWDEWLGANQPHKIICPEGHTSYTRATYAMRYDTGVCAQCGYAKQKERSEANFRARLEEWGATPAWDKYLGHTSAHRVICSEGHECWPWPNGVSNGGQNPCKRCADKTSLLHRQPVIQQWLDASEQDYLMVLAKYGATPMWETWLGSAKSHLIECKRGHLCSPRPTHIMTSGTGVCRFCIGLEWDVFYIVVNTREQRVKIGITSGDPKSRMRQHANDGYTQVILLIHDIDARELENLILKQLRTNDYIPVLRREYFSLNALSFILGVLKSNAYLETE